MSAYFYIYNNWRIYELPWNSAVTWLIAAVFADFAYYWVHRAAHGKIKSELLSNQIQII